MEVELAERRKKLKNKEKEERRKRANGVHDERRGR